MTSVITPLDTGHTWKPAAGVTERGHVVLFAGRGEHAGVYERLGRRLAYDGYRLSAVSGLGGDELRAVLADGAGASPLVLGGSDTGALRALGATGLPVAGYLLAGVPTGGAGIDVGWADELDARTACPVHRGRLEGDGAFARGALGEPVPAELASSAAHARVTVPVLLVHGAGDRVAPLAGVRALAAGLPYAELLVVRDGRHDVLNDANHRSVAASVVMWLERLRADPSATPIVVPGDGR